MKSAKSYVLYTEEKKAFCKVCSINSKIAKNTSVFKVKIKQYIGDTNKIIEQDIDIDCSTNNIVFSCSDENKILNFRVGYSIEKWSKYRQYAVGEVIWYNNKIYSLVQYVEKGNTPNLTQWKECIDYSNTSYSKNSVVLWKNGKYYISKEEIMLGENPENSSKWEYVNGIYSLYCGINSSASYVETIIIDGEEDKIQLYPYNSELYYCNLDATNTINGESITVPKIIEYSTNYTEGIVSPIKSLSNTIITPKNISTAREYYKIMTINLVNNSRLDFNIKIQSMEIGDKVVYGDIMFRIIGDTSSVNRTIKGVTLTPDTFIKDNFNIYMSKSADGVINIYLMTYSDKYKLMIENIFDSCQSKTRRNFGNSIIDIINDPVVEKGYNGELLATLFA